MTASVLAPFPASTQHQKHTLLPTGFVLGCFCFLLFWGVWQDDDPNSRTRQLALSHRLSAHHARSGSYPAHAAAQGFAVGAVAIQVDRMTAPATFKQADVQRSAKWPLECALPNRTVGERSLRLEATMSNLLATFWHDTSTGNRLDAKTAAKIGLAPLQITAVIAVFFVTSIGAVGLAWAFKKWNSAHAY